MPVTYRHVTIPDTSVPRARSPLFQHLVQTYASECNKVVSVWLCFRNDDLDWRPHPKASTVRDTLKHQLLSERRFFGEFLGTPEPAPSDVLPADLTIQTAIQRFVELAQRRLPFFAEQDEAWWLTEMPFFDTRRERIWVFWRRVLHAAHHRTQLTVYLRLLDRPVPSTYGPTGDDSWEGADPTHSVEAAGRK